MVDLNKAQIFDSPIDCLVRDSENYEWLPKKLVAILPEYVEFRYVVQSHNGSCVIFKHCTLTDPYEPKKRLATQEELMAFAITHCNKLQSKILNGEWDVANWRVYNDHPENYYFRTVEWNNGKPVYGEPFQLWMEVEE